MSFRSFFHRSGVLLCVLLMSVLCWTPAATSQESTEGSASAQPSDASAEAAPQTAETAASDDAQKKSADAKATDQPTATPPAAEESKPADESQPEESKPAEQSPADEWKTLSDRRWEIARKLKDLKAQFADADSTRRREIRTEFDGLIFEFNVHVRPRLTKLAAAVYEADPANQEAGEVVLRTAWEGQDMSTAQQVAESLLQAGNESSFVLNTAGYVYSELGDYAAAKKTLDQADLAGKLDPVNGVRYRKLSQAYLDHAAGTADAAAIDMIVEDAYLHHRYQQAIDIASARVEAGEKSEAVLSYLAASQFALNDFAAAKETFTLAKADDKLNFTAQQLATQIDQYVTYWMNEVALREAEGKAASDQALPHVVLTTNKGEIELALCENEAPNTVANFISLVEAGKYDGTKFHRVIPNFVIQGGDPNSLDDDPTNDGQGGPGYTIACECYADNARKHFRGSLSMAHAGKDTGGSQFFITHRPTTNLNADADQSRGHTVFGYVVRGMDVVDAITKNDTIEKAVVTSKRDHKYEPVTIAE